MTDIAFEQDEKVNVHEEGAISLICKAFTSHDAGLPEWIKNASDMYARRDIGPARSVIVVLLTDGSTSKGAVVACLDFGGMTTEDIETRFRNWADPEASSGSGNVEGGHGNGGKCYMTQLFASHSYIHTLKEGRANRYGFRSGSFIPGYIPSRAEARGYSIANAEAELASALQAIGLRYSDLPPDAMSAFEQSKGFTLVAGFGAKHLARNKIPAARWIESLTNHQQMIRSIEQNKIFILHNGKTIAGADPLHLPQITSISGAEAPRIVQVPAELMDPLEEEMVATGAIEGMSQLVLRTSDKSMRWGLKGRHTVNGWTHGHASTGYWDVPSLSRSAYSEKIYGDVYLEALSDYKQNDRRNHSDAPLTRALRQWLSEQIDAYAAEFVKLEQLQASKEEKDDLSNLNRQLDIWKNKFLEEQFGGLGAGSTGGRGTTTRSRLPRGEVSRIALRLSHESAGRGVSFRPILDFYDNDDRRVRAVPFEWQSSDWAVATIDPELNMITTHAAGTSLIKVLCKDSGVQSNEVRLEVHDIKAIELEPRELELRAGSRAPLRAIVSTSDGRHIDGTYLIWTEDDDSVAQAGASGMVFGLTPGTTQISAADEVASSEPAKIVVLEARPDETGGSGFPKILLSEIDDDPLGEGAPIFSSAEPPVHQRPQDVDHNIWWINTASPLARRYLGSDPGGGAKSKEWRVYLLERYIEIVVKILLTYSYSQGEDITFETMLRRWDEEAVLMQARALESLQGFLGGEAIDNVAA
jgi:hypothetical protein